MHVSRLWISCIEVPRRAEGDNKYTAGHVLVVGGSRGLTGAPSLTAMAAMRADAGYVSIAVPESTLPVFEQRLLEAVKRPLPDEGGLIAEGSAELVRELALKATAVALGPGLGRGRGPQELVRHLLARLELPVVVDADALYQLEPADWPGPRVLTPHEGELGASARQAVEGDRGAPAGERAGGRRALRLRVVLKGPDTLVAAPGRELYVVSLGLAVARNGRHRRRSDRHRRGVSRQRHGSSARCRRPRRSRSSARRSRRPNATGSSQAI